MSIERPDEATPKHDLLAHAVVGGFGITAPDCPACEARKCEPRIIQDGYDSGLALDCRTHDAYEPVMVVERHGRVGQTYEVTLAMVERLVAEHHAKHYDASPAVAPEWPVVCTCGASEVSPLTQHLRPCPLAVSCGRPYTDRNGDPDTCSFPAGHDGSCW